MTFIPDSISTDALEALAENADSEPESANKHMSEKEMEKLVCDTIEELTDKFETVFGYKLAAHYCLYMLFKHHNAVHNRICEENGEFEVALSWARDAGWLQMMFGNLANIDCGTEDFLSND